MQWLRLNLKKNWITQNGKIRWLFKIKSLKLSCRELIKIKGEKISFLKEKVSQVWCKKKCLTPILLKLWEPELLKSAIVENVMVVS